MIFIFTRLSLLPLGKLLSKPSNNLNRCISLTSLFEILDIRAEITPNTSTLLVSFTFLIQWSLLYYTLFTR